MFRSLLLALVLTASAAYGGGVVFPTTKYETVGGITWMYVVRDGEATIGQGNMVPAIPAETAGSVTVPGTIGGHPVTAIERHAFYQCAAITSLTIPDGVRSIGYLACGGCTSLAAVRLPAGLTATPDGLFKECVALKSAVIPESVTSFGRDAFWGCTSLTNATLPSSLTVLPPQTFYRCSSLREISLPPNLAEVGVSAFSWCTGLAAIDLPDSVAKIGGSAFEKCESLTALKLPSGLTHLTGCLGRCTGLRSLTLPAGLVSMDDGALTGCTGLAGVDVEAGNPVYRSVNGALAAGDTLLFWPAKKTPVEIPDGIRVLGRSLFENNTSLTSVVIPKSVEEIGDYAFYHTGLTSVSLPDGLTKIGDCAFLWTPLAAVDVPAATESIGRNAFANSRSLSAVTIRHPNVRLGDGVFSSDVALSSLTFAGRVASVGAGVFSGCVRLPSPVAVQGALLGFANDPSGKLAVADGITDIAGPVFGAHVTHVTLPASITNLAASAFAGCTSLKEVVAPPAVALLVDALRACVGTPSRLLVASLPPGPPYAAWEFEGGQVVDSPEPLAFPCAAEIVREAVELRVALRWTQAAGCSAAASSGQLAPEGRMPFEFGIDDKFSLAVVRIANGESEGRLAFALTTDACRELSGTVPELNRWHDFRIVFHDGRFRVEVDDVPLVFEKEGPVFSFASGAACDRIARAWVAGSGLLGNMSVRHAGAPVGFAGLGTNIPTGWAEGYPSFSELYGTDVSAALVKLTGKTDANGRALCVWHDFVAGTDPTDADDIFRAEIALDGGCPVVMWRPAKVKDGFERRYSIFGKTKADDDWTDVTEEKDLTPWSFFKVSVAIP